jgi:hypothetical protein
MEVTVTFKVEEPEYQVLTSRVVLNTDETVLNPTLARAAARIAFGHARGCEVWSDEGFGYRLYPNSHRKVYEY